MGALFSFRGRCGRLAYLGIFVVQMGVLVLGITIGAVGLVAGAKNSADGAAAISVLVFLAVLIATIWIGAAALARRTRDMGWDPKVVVPLWYGVSALVWLAPPLLPFVYLFQLVVGGILIFKGPVPFDDDDRRVRGHTVGDGGTADGDLDRALAALLAAREAQRAEAGTPMAASTARPSLVQHNVAQRAAPRTSAIQRSPARRGGFGQRGLA